MCTRFQLPKLGNVLALMLLPLGCSLSRTVYLWGFDGRAPQDKLFWANSSKHTYPELMPALQKAHPCFFDHYVPHHDPARYVNQFHGERAGSAAVSCRKIGISLSFAASELDSHIAETIRDTNPLL